MGSRLFFLLGQSCSFSRALSTAAAPSPFHPRNRHTGRYDFAALAAASPPLAAVLAPDARTGELSLDWSSRRAVLALNAAIALRDCEYLLRPALWSRRAIRRFASLEREKERVRASERDRASQIERASEREESTPDLIAERSARHADR